MARRKDWIMVKRGLSEDAKHRERMGMRIWLYLHIINRADWETGIVYDWRDKDEAEDMEMSQYTLRNQRQELEQLGYIQCQKTGRGQNIVIYKWVNPRNYSGQTLNLPTEEYPDSVTREYPDSVTQSNRPFNRPFNRPSINDSVTPSIIAQGSGIRDQEAHSAPKPPAPPTGKRSQKATANPLSQSPEIQMFRAITGHYPPQEHYESIIAILRGQERKTAESYWLRWLTVSSNRYNLTWLLEWMASGRPASEFGANGTRRSGHEESRGLAGAKAILADGGIDGDE